MTIRPLRPADAPRALAVAAAAFAEDPLFVHVYPDPATRERRFAQEHAAYVQHVYRPYGRMEVADLDGQIAGMALWLPPGAEVPRWRDVPMAWALLRSIGARRFPTVFADYRAFDASLPSTPHWYLGLLAVAPGAQGRGAGSTLVRTGLARADRDRTGTYLETGTDRNVAFYRRLGFEKIHEVRLPHGPDHTGMWRPPSRDA